MNLSDFFDAIGNLHVGSFGRLSKARITVDHRADDIEGIGLDIAPTRAGAARKAGIKLGDFVLTQDVLGNGTLNFGILDSTGAVVINFSTAFFANLFNSAVSTVGVVHMQADTSITALTALSEVPAATTQAQANARANALQTAAAAHAASAGTVAAAGKHKAADATASATLALVPIASSLATSKTLTTALLAWLNAHAVEAGVHFHDDATAAAATVSDSTPDDLDEVAVVLNEIMVLMKAHFARAQ